MPVNPEKLISYCEKMAEEFQARLSRIESFVKHNLTSGTANETILREFLSKHSPASFFVGEGFICDLFESGEASKQCDILVYEQDNIPLVYSEGTIKVVLPRSATMVVEVKTSFNKKDIHSAIRNIESSKKLNQRITGIIFAFKSNSVNAIKKSLESYPDEIAESHLPSVILLFDKNIIIHRWSWQRNKELESNPNANYISFSIRKTNKEKKGLIIICLLLLLFESTTTVFYNADVINLLLQVFDKYTEIVDTDVIIGSKNSKEILISKNKIDQY